MQLAHESEEGWSIQVGTDLAIPFIRALIVRIIRVNSDAGVVGVQTPDQARSLALNVRRWGRQVQLPVVSRVFDSFFALKIAHDVFFL
jgi:hypothetical protein